MTLNGWGIVSISVYRGEVRRMIEFFNREPIQKTKKQHPKYVQRCTVISGLGDPSFSVLGHCYIYVPLPWPLGE